MLEFPEQDIQSADSIYKYKKNTQKALILIPN